MKKIDEYIEYVKTELLANKKHNRVMLQNKAKDYGIVDKTEVKEYTELAIVLAAKSIANKANKETFDKIVSLYQNQMNMSFRTSMSMLLQQYSTPVPIGYLMCMYCGLEDQTKTLFEPSAGNGALTILANPKRTFVNELDKLRRENLERYNQYAFVGNNDATKDFISSELNQQFDAVISNPPFGKLDQKKNYHGFPISDLDHFMVLHALEKMKDSGKAAFIIGGHTKYDKLGRVARGKNSYFLHALYKHYHVEDIIPIDGHQLYRKQGTSFDTRLILINGRKKEPKGMAPNLNNISAEVVSKFENLFNRINRNFDDEDIKEALNIAKELELIMNQF